MEKQINITRFTNREGMSLIQAVPSPVFSKYTLYVFKDYLTEDDLIAECPFTDAQNTAFNLGRVDLLFNDIFPIGFEDGYYLFEIEEYDVDGNYLGSSDTFDLAIYDATEALVFSKTGSLTNETPIPLPLTMCWMWLEYMKTVERTTRLNEDFYKRKEQIEQILLL